MLVSLSFRQKSSQNKFWSPARRWTPEFILARPNEQKWRKTNDTNKSLDLLGKSKDLDSLSRTSYYPPNSIPCANGKLLDQLIVFVWRRM